MVSAEQISTIAAKAARSHLPSKVVQRVFSEPTIDSEGKAALRLTIVIAPDSVSRITGDALLDTLVQIQRDLQAEGEDRLAIVEYATEDELHDVSD